MSEQRGRRGASDVARQERGDALRALAARRQRGASIATPAVPVAPPRRSRRLVLLCAVLAALVVVGGVFLWLRQHAGPSGPVLMAVDNTFVGDPIACPAQAAWAPDSTRIAIVGFNKCPSDNQPYPGAGDIAAATLTLYDAHTGHALTTTDLSATILAHAIPASVRGDPSALSQAFLLFDGLVWSPSGDRIALSFATFHPAGAGLENYAAGLLVVPATGAPRVILAPAQAARGPASYPTTTFAPLPVTRFDLTSNTATAFPLPQALGYTWAAGGALTPTLSVPANATDPAATATLAPVGNPDGGATFSAWQSGTVGFGTICAGQSPAAQCCAATSYLVAAYGTLAAWSPDGRYVVLPTAGTNLAIGAVGKLPAPPAASVANVPNACAGPAVSEQYARLPLRDKGLSNALTGFDLSRTGLLLAWSPDGRRVAVRADHSLNGVAHAFSLYDTQSGHLIAQYTARQLEPGLPANRGNSYIFAITAPAWSPDGKHLLLLDTNLQVLSILGPNMLGG